MRTCAAGRKTAGKRKKTLQPHKRFDKILLLAGCTSIWQKKFNVGTCIVESLPFLVCHMSPERRQVFGALSHNVTFFVLCPLAICQNIFVSKLCALSVFWCYCVQVQDLHNNLYRHSNAPAMGCSASAVAHRPISMNLTPAQKYLLRESWETVEQNKMAIGKKTFMR